MADFIQANQQGQQDPDAIRKAILARLMGSASPVDPNAPLTAPPGFQPTDMTPAATSPAAKPLRAPQSAAPGGASLAPAGLTRGVNGSAGTSDQGSAPLPTFQSEEEWNKANPPAAHTPYQAPDLKHRLLEGLFAGMQEFGRPGEGARTVRDYLTNIQQQEDAEKNFPDTSAAAQHQRYMTAAQGAEQPLHIQALQAQIKDAEAQAADRAAQARARLNPAPKYERAFIEDPEHPGQGKHADFDPRSGQFIDPDTQKIIPGAKPYVKPEREAGTIPADIEARLGPKPTADPKNPTGPVQWNGKSFPSEHAAQAAWGTAVAKAIDDHARAAGEARGAGFAQTKLMNVIRNGTVMAIHPDEMQPGDVLSGASAGEHAMTKSAQIADIRNSIQNVKDKAKVLDTGFKDRAVLATALADPNATLASFAQSTVRNRLSPEEEDYVISVLNAREQIAGLRSLLGAGQVSDARMKLMLQTIPGAATGSSEFAGKQIDRALKDLELLEKGVPKMPGAKDETKNAGAGGNYPAGWTPRKKQ
jgi:hypothetical protein